MKKPTGNLQVSKSDVDLHQRFKLLDVHSSNSFKDKPCVVASLSDSLDRRQHGAILFMAFIPSEKKLTYREKLQDPKWQQKRLKIFERDNWTCQDCGDKTTTLHVHHERYFGNPWDAPDSFLKTICATCHKKIHAPVFEDPNSQLSPVELAEKLIEDLEKKMRSGRYGEKAISTWTQAIVIAQNEIERIAAADPLTTTHKSA